jgi:hypothetical protein
LKIHSVACRVSWFPAGLRYLHATGESVAAVGPLQIQSIQCLLTKEVS